MCAYGDTIRITIAQGTGNEEGDLQISEDELGIEEKNTKKQEQYETVENRESKEAKPGNRLKRFASY